MPGGGGSPSVTLSVDGTPVGTLSHYATGSGSTSMFPFSWDSTTVAAGAHTLQALVVDPVGNSSSTTINVLVDNAAPSVAITAPAPGADVPGGAVAVQVTASDAVAVASVALYADGVLQSTLTAAPWNFTWNTSGLASGSTHTLTARATNAGGIAASASISVTVDSAPSVAITAPASGADVPAGAIAVQVTASDAVAVASVALYADGVLQSTLTVAPWNFTWNTSALANGSAHTLTATATNAAGVTASASISVTVDNTPPTATITSSFHGRVSGTVNVAVSASDDMGIDHVSLNVDSTTLVGTLNAAPYNFSWNTHSVANGNHNLTATAWDKAGNKASSAPVTVTVRN
jgi:hypothetical protein